MNQHQLPQSWALTELKRREAGAGGDLMVYGHGQFGQALSDAGLVDELTLNIVPVFVAAGTPFFRAGGQSRSWHLVSVGPGAEPGLAALTFRPTTES